MKLCHFPNVLKGFWEIADDQPHPDGVTGNPRPSAEVPDTWLERFKLLESALVKLDDKTPRGLELVADDLVDTSVADIPAWISVALPGNEDDILILTSLGYSPDDIEKMRSVYNTFFDGDELESLRVQ